MLQEAPAFHTVTGWSCSWSVPAMFQLLQPVNEFSDWRGQVSCEKMALSYCLISTDWEEIQKDVWQATHSNNSLNLDVNWKSSYQRIIWISSKCLWTLTSKSKEFMRKKTHILSAKISMSWVFFFLSTLGWRLIFPKFFTRKPKEHPNSWRKDKIAGLREIQSHASLALEQRIQSGSPKSQAKVLPGN